MHRDIPPYVVRLLLELPPIEHVIVLVECRAIMAAALEQQENDQKQSAA